MITGTVRVLAVIPRACSLKEKRRILRSLKDRLRNKFNVAVAELNHQNQWQLTELGIVTISSSRRYVNQILSEVQNFLHQEIALQVLNCQLEIS
jgi:hypothetical protein